VAQLQKLPAPRAVALCSPQPARRRGARRAASLLRPANTCAERHATCSAVKLRVTNSSSRSRAPEQPVHPSQCSPKTWPRVQRTTWRDLRPENALVQRRAEATVGMRQKSASARPARGTSSNVFTLRACGVNTDAQRPAQGVSGPKLACTRRIRGSCGLGLRCSTGCSRSAAWQRHVHPAKGPRQRASALRTLQGPSRPPVDGYSTLFVHLRQSGSATGAQVSGHASDAGKRKKKKEKQSGSPAQRARTTCCAKKRCVRPCAPAAVACQTGQALASGPSWRRPLRTPCR
jgi:hypothetical protein